MTSTPTPNIRLTISVTPEVHAAFLRMSKASNVSIGRSMGLWLQDTLEAAEFMASTMEKARSSPKIVIEQLQAYTLGLQDELSSVMQVVRKKGQEDRAVRALEEGPRLRGVASGAVDGGLPPPSNTGGKGTNPKSVQRGKKSVSTLGKSSVGPAKVQAYADTNGI